MTDKHGKSPYQRKGKTPYRYSDEYYAWAASPGYQTSLRHAVRLIRAFGPQYWMHDNGKETRLLLPAEAYQRA